MIRSYIASVFISLPLMIVLSGCAGWGLNIIQLLALSALYVSSTMAIHHSCWYQIATAIRRKEERKQDDH